MRLQSDKCVVRDWKLEDKPSLVRYANDRRVWRNLLDIFPHPYTEAAADAWLALVTTMSPCTHWAVEVDGRAVGGVGFDVGQGVFCRTAHLGYWLGEPYWGRGIMTEAVRGVVRHAFASYDLERLEAPVFEWNPGSMRVLEKCGFVREAVLRKSAFKDGQLIDMMLYACVREPGRLRL